MRTFGEIRDELGKDHTHHLRLHCVSCGTVETCRCSAPKEDYYGICYDCEEMTFKVASSIMAGFPLPLVAGLLQSLDRKLLQRTLWYEDEEGNVWEPDLEGNDIFNGAPEGFIYQHSAFPTMLRHSILKITQPSEVAACDHPEESVTPTGGWCEPYEGRKCNQCGGTQLHTKGEPWPDKWDASGCTNLGAFEMGWSDELVVGMITVGFSVSEAIMAAATCCERCMNVMAYECGLQWGYAWGSDDWEKCGTSCKFCEGL